MNPPFNCERRVFCHASLTTSGSLLFQKDLIQNLMKANYDKLKVQPLRQLNIAVLCLLIFFTYSCNSKKEINSYDKIFDNWEDSLPKLFDAHDLTGLTIAVVNDREIIWLKCYGHTDTSKTGRVDGSTLFSVQSVSKNITAMAVMKAVEDGLVDLDIPVTDYLPGFSVNSRFEDSPASKMTLRLLLSHRAGFTHEAPVGNNYDNSGSFEEHVKSINDTWLRFPVDQRFSYSNLGVDLAGFVIQEVSGMPFHEYVEKNVLKPTGMIRSSFDGKRISDAGNRARGYNRQLVEAPFSIPIIPSGGLYSTAEELASYVMLHINGGRRVRSRVIGEESLALMYEIPGRLPWQINGYGLGTTVRNEYGLLLLGHGGSGFGFCSNMIWSPEEKLGIVMLTNTSSVSFQNSLPQKILFDLIEARRGQALASQYPQGEYNEPEITVDSLDQKRMAGIYLYNSGGIMILEYCNGRMGAGSPENFQTALFTSPEDFNFGDRGYPTFYSIKEGSSQVPYILIRHYDGTYLDWNEGWFDGQGPDKSEWHRYTGSYCYYINGRLAANPIDVTIKNGWLYVFNFKLSEYESGLFFTAHGEALDFRGETPVWRNIRLYKQADLH